MSKLDLNKVTEMIRDNSLSPEELARQLRAMIEEARRQRGGRGMSATEARVQIRDRNGNVVGEMRSDVWDAIRDALQMIMLIEEAENSLIPTDVAQDVLELLDL